MSTLKYCASCRQWTYRDRERLYDPVNYWMPVVLGSLLAAVVVGVLGSDPDVGVGGFWGGVGIISLWPIGYSLGFGGWLLNKTRPWTVEARLKREIRRAEQEVDRLYLRAQVEKAQERARAAFDDYLRQAVTS